MTASTSPAVSLQDLPILRTKTEKVSKFLRQQATGYLETLRPVLHPERLFGKFAGGRVEVPGADRLVAELKSKYAAFTSKPYDLPLDFDPNWLALVGGAVDLHPCDYTYVVGGNPVTMTAPVKWILAFRSTYTPANVQAVLLGQEPARLEHLRQFVVNAMVLQMLLARNPGLTQLLEGLRCTLSVETLPAWKGLPLITLSSALSSFRPPDDLIASAIAFSGVPAFIELIDLKELAQPRDPLRAELEKLVGAG